MKFTKAEKEKFLEVMVSDLERLQRPRFLYFMLTGSLIILMFVLSMAMFTQGGIGLYLGTLISGLAGYLAFGVVEEAKQYFTVRWFLKGVAKENSIVRATFMEHLDDCKGAPELFKKIQHGSLLKED